MQRQRGVRVPDLLCDILIFCYFGLGCMYSALGNFEFKTKIKGLEKGLQFLALDLTIFGNLCLHFSLSTQLHDICLYEPNLHHLTVLIILQMDHLFPMSE